MTFKPATWFPIAVVLSLANVAAVAFAVGPVHATSHVVLAVAFGLWAQRLLSALKNEVRDQLEDPLERLDGLEIEIDRMRQELSETQERVDFAERLLAQRREG